MHSAVKVYSSLACFSYCRESNAGQLLCTEVWQVSASIMEFTLAWHMTVLSSEISQVLLCSLCWQELLNNYLTVLFGSASDEQH